MSTPTMADVPVDPGAEPARSPFERFGLHGRALGAANWIAVAVGIYLLITAVSVIGDGFKLATRGQAEELFAFASNPLIALMIGVLATALIQSSSTVTSITVGLVAGGLPMATAIPMLMGANIGTTLTSTLVSLGMVRQKEDFRRAFAAASVHDFFNLLAVVIFLPLEMMFGILDRASTFLADQLAGSDGGLFATIFAGIGNAVTAVTDPLADLIGLLGGVLPAPWGGIVLIFIGIGLILAVINFIGVLLKVVMVGTAKQVLHNAIGRGPLSGILSGTLITVMVQSSSTTTSLMVPLAGSGTFSLRQVYPFTLGANIGTTITALIAAFAFTGVEARLALQAALVHLLFNLLATALIYGLPFLREIPILGATTLARLGAENKLYIIGWVLGVFLALPALLIFLTVIF
ncbi:NptA protein [Corynebacterium humireducens NBRC 106098 = DSM 45392]|uniref:NptA protein n=1 Tax=Corynebacterium humireducens NBRC 106098 = DSM 45392 TaxID=1223515 RepID=A0A0B5D2U4_9CORY|nr:Na/Pi symporter [Corynebacterium humireducens]AJE33051.1 NptA protein [Corynebacterium humireducens NBRC 106098 = DSM 45392]